MENKDVELIKKMIALVESIDEQIIDEQLKGISNLFKRIGSNLSSNKKFVQMAKAAYPNGTNAAPNIKKLRDLKTKLRTSFNIRGTQADELIAGAAALGGAYVLGGSIARNNNRFVRKDTKEEFDLSEFPGCILNLPPNLITPMRDKNGKIVVKIPDGIDAESSNHGGLYFWATGGVASKDKQLAGTYTCKSDELVVQEQLDDIPDDPNYNPYADYTNIQITWKIKPDVPQPESNKVQTPPQPLYTYKEDFPFEYMTKNPKIKNIQIALGFPEKYQTGNFGPITKGAMEKDGYDVTNGITQDLYTKILSDKRAQSNPMTGYQGKQDKISQKSPTQIKTTGYAPELKPSSQKINEPNSIK